MHLPDGFFNDGVATGLIASAIGAVAVSLYKVKSIVLKKVKALKLATNIGNIDLIPFFRITKKGKTLLKKMVVMSGVLLFIQLISFPLLPSQYEHLIGGLLAAIILGPWAGFLTMTFVLSFQEIFFGSANLSILAANIFHMGIIAVIAAYYIFNFLKKIIGKKSAIVVTCIVSFGLVALFEALVVAITDNLSYLNLLGSIITIHILLGVIEGIITLIAHSYLNHDSPD